MKTINNYHNTYQSYQYGKISSSHLGNIPESNIYDELDRKEEVKNTQSKLARRSTLGLPNFKLGYESSPCGDRYIPKRKDQDSNIAFYEINHENSPPTVLDRDQFENSIEYEEK